MRYVVNIRRGFTVTDVPPTFPAVCCTSRADRHGPSTDRHGPSTDRHVHHGPSTDMVHHGPSTDSHGPSRSINRHGPSTDRHGPSPDMVHHGPSTDRHGPSTDSHGPSRSINRHGPSRSINRQTRSITVHHQSRSITRQSRSITVHQQTWSITVHLQTWSITVHQQTDTVHHETRSRHSPSDRHRACVCPAKPSFDTQLPTSPPPHPIPCFRLPDCPWFPAVRHKTVMSDRSMKGLALVPEWTKEKNMKASFTSQSQEIATARLNCVFANVLEYVASSNPLNITLNLKRNEARSARAQSTQRELISTRNTTTKTR